MFPPSATAATPNPAAVPGSRRVTAWLVLVVMLLTASFGEFAAASRATVTMIGGVPVVMCGDEAGGGDPSAPAKGHTGPACCDHCVLGAPVLPPAAPSFARPQAVLYAFVPYATTGWTPALSRARTPRQSQGPPRRA